MMQAIARELNLAETVFVGPATRAGCAVRLRIFTPAHEMAFAGHPTIGASWVLQAEGIVARDSERFLLDEGIGAIPIRIERGTPSLIWLSTPPVRTGQRYESALCAKLLGLDTGDLLDLPPQWLSAGNPIAVIAAKSTAAVDRAGLDRAGQQALQGADGTPVCAYVFAPVRGGAYGRMFAPILGVPEDPATGSAMGPLATFMMRHGLVDARRAFPVRTGHQDGPAQLPSCANRCRRRRTDRCRRQRRTGDRSGDDALTRSAVSDAERHEIVIMGAARALR